jgi:sigma-B regulation protein RsbU (phosphoserine phosphatase)
LLTQTIPAQLNLQKGQVLLDVTPPAHTEEYETLKKGSIVWLHKKADGTFKTHPSPLAEWQAAGVWACLPLLSGDKILGLYGVGPKKSGEYYNREEITLLETLARQAGVALQNAQLHQELSTQVRIRRDLEIAHQIQLSLLPLQAPAIPGLDIAGFSHPADEVGGDFYHYFDFADGRAGIAVGDVSGKGVSAALYMAVSLSTLRAQATHYLHTADLLTEMNNVLHTQMELNAMNVAMLYALFEKNGSPHKWTFRVSNAGLIAPLLYRKGQPGVYVDSGGLPIGAIAAVNYQEHCLELASGDLIIVCSDGVVEAQNRQGEMFGFERLEQTLSRPNGISAGEAVNTLNQAVTHFVGSAPQHDDITVVAVRVK